MAFKIRNSVEYKHFRHTLILQFFVKNKSKEGNFTSEAFNALINFCSNELNQRAFISQAAQCNNFGNKQTNSL